MTRSDMPQLLHYKIGSRMDANDLHFARLFFGKRANLEVGVDLILERAKNLQHVFREDGLGIVVVIAVVVSSLDA